jgi:hypothetical protein
MTTAKEGKERKIEERKMILGRRNDKILNVSSVRRRFGRRVRAGQGI